MRFVGDPGGARTHDPLIKSPRPFVESTACAAGDGPGSGANGPASRGFDQGFDQVPFFACSEAVNTRLRAVQLAARLERKNSGRLVFSWFLCGACQRYHVYPAVAAGGAQ